MVAAIFFLPENIIAFQFGIFVLGFSDALANILGDLLGRHRIKILGGYKSLEGSLVFFITTLILLMIFVAEPSLANLEVYLMIALFLTLLEFLLFLGLDNLFLPVLAAYLFSLL